MKKERIKHGDLLLSVSGKSPQTYVKIIVCFFLILVFSIKGFSQDVHRAVFEGDLEKVKLLLKENPLLVNKEDSSGRTPIFTAIIRRNPEMVKLLIDKGALLRVGDSNLRAPIHFAGFMNDMNMIELLLENGAVIDTRAIGAATPLIHSSLFWLAGLSDDYTCSKRDTKAVEFVRGNFPGVNLMFLGTPDGIGPEIGNGIRETYLESMGLNPDAVFFMGKEHLGRRILYQVKRRIQNPKNIYCAENPGDMFFYVQGEIR